METIAETGFLVLAFLRRGPRPFFSGCFGATGSASLGSTGLKTGCPAPGCFFTGAGAVGTVEYFFTSRPLRKARFAMILVVQYAPLSLCSRSETGRLGAGFGFVAGCGHFFSAP